jgi:hypothetical protein
MKYIILCLFLLSGCAQIDPPEQVKTVTVTWKSVDNIDSYCKSLYKERGIDKPWYTTIYACVTYDKALTKCTIYTGKHPNTAMLGHEVQHCFMGKWHD